MPLPKRRHSKARQRKRRTHHGLSLPTLTECSNCNTMIPTHNACHKCGFYQGRKVDHTVKDEDEKKKKKED